MWEAASILLVIFLVLANGFFVASEFSLVGVRRSRILTLANKGDKRAKRLLGMIDDLNAYISATQLGITFASLALGWIGEPAISHLLEIPFEGMVSPVVLHTIAFTIAFAIITALHIVIGELAPKTLALERMEHTALAVALPLQIFYKVFSYPIRALNWAGMQTVKLFGLHATGEHSSVYTEEEIRHLVDLSHEHGHLEQEEKQLIHRAFDFADVLVREAMIPRVSVETISADATLDDITKQFRDAGYSRFPVYRDSVDNIVGILFRRDLEPFLAAPKGFELEPLLHKPLYIPETGKLGDALRQMQMERMHLAVVIDEHGGMEGIVTLEDILEEIVGEIDDEYDTETRSQIVKQDDGSYLLDGMLAVRDANRVLNLDIPEDSDYTTLAGFLMSRAGRMLEIGDIVEIEARSFVIERVNKRRIRSVRLTAQASTPS